MTLQAADAVLVIGQLVLVGVGEVVPDVFGDDLELVLNQAKAS